MVSARWIQWKTSMWTQLYGVYFSLSLFKLQFIFGKITRKLCDVPRINPWNLWDSYFKWPRGWSLIRQKLLDWPRLIGSSLCGERRLCWLTELFNLRLPKPTSFPTQCCVWEASVMNQTKLGKAGSNGFWKHIISKIWIGLTGSRRSPSGKISQDSQHWEFSTRFKRFWLNQSVNLSDFKEGSFSCPCTMTLHGENEEIKIFFANALKTTGYAQWFPQGRWSFLEPWPEKKRYGTYTDKPDGGWNKTAAQMMLNFAESSHIRYFVPPAPWIEEN